MSGPMDPSSGDIHFGTGGFQGAEGHGSGAEWFVENVMEELDAPNEYFFDPQTSELYLYYNGTGAPPSSVEVPLLTELVTVVGSQAKPVVNLSFTGVTFTGQQPTYMEPQ